MKYEDQLANVTVLGAAGKMGSGIVLLTAMEMTNQKLKGHNKDNNFVLNALDVSHKALSDLMNYVRDQAKKVAEKRIVTLRAAYASRQDLIDNEDVISQYVFDVLNVIRPVTAIEAAYESNIIFEAVSENPKLKISLLSKIQKNTKNNPWFFTNTSAIPIGFLDKEAALDGYVMGVHFYNPPAIQKLVEVIKAETTRPELSYFVTDFIKNIGKLEVPSHDVAGFIGNGYFVRDVLYGLSLMEKLQKNFSFPEAVNMVNSITQDFLIRPMGIFQLADYVGIDVIQFIMEVMQHNIKKEKIHSKIIDEFIEQGVKGGQYPNGSQKDGFFNYQKGKLSGVYDIGKKRYIPLNEIASTCDDYLGKPPLSYLPWKILIRDENKENLLTNYFADLKLGKSMGALHAREYLQRYKQIGLNLVKEKVALKFDDVNLVLIHGFQHAYGPVNNFSE